MLSSSGPHRQVYQVMKTPRLIHFQSVSLKIKVQSVFFQGTVYPTAVHRELGLILKEIKVAKHPQK